MVRVQEWDGNLGRSVVHGGWRSERHLGVVVTGAEGGSAATAF